MIQTAEKKNGGVELREATSSLLSVYSHAVQIRELKGYSRDGGINVPVWGDRIAVYHPVRSELTRLNPEGWKVFDSVSSGTSGINEISQQTGIEQEQTGQIAQELRDRWIFLPQDEELQVTLKPHFDQETELYLETTEACNFRCPGCATGADRYMRGEAKTMEEANLQEVLEAAARSSAEKGIKKMRVKWAGGEVLMPKPFELVKGAQEAIAKLQETYPVEISQVILTNGAYLTEQNVTAIKEFKDVHVSVSLWGIGEENDRSRRPLQANGRYDNLVQGIQRLHDAGITFNINHVVTPENASQFGRFLRAVWDTKSEEFIGRGWQDPQPIPIGLSFFRPQTKEQLVQLQKQGYGQMVQGLRSGFEVARELIERGETIPPLDKIDYLQLFGVIPTPCGSGFNYLAVGPRGVASCHEALFTMEPNMDQVTSGRVNLIDLANTEYVGRRDQLIGVNIGFKDIGPTTRLILALHGGSGCPRTVKDENHGQLGNAASIVPLLYSQIVQELLSLETMRRLKMN